jgi:hypothetical protein
MISNNLLSDKLNSFKKNKNSPKEDKISPTSNPIFEISSTFFTLIFFIVKLFVYGYSMKLIFSTNWDFLGIICIGLTITLLLDYIHNLIHTTS